MSLQLLTHPVTTFVAGLVVATAAILLLLKFSALPNRSAETVAELHSRLEKAAPSGFEAGGAGEKAALDRFTKFLQGISDVKFVREQTLQVYAADAYLDDTLVVHRGASEIEAYFVQTSETMKSYKVTIDDVAKSGDDYYVRWTMVFSAPLLSGGAPVHSIGISQVRFNREGKVAVHQDYWDSGKNIYGHLPVVGGVIGIVRKRLESN